MAGQFRVSGLASWMSVVGHVLSLEKGVEVVLATLGRRFGRVAKVASVRGLGLSRPAAAPILSAAQASDGLKREGGFRVYAPS